MKRTLLGVLAIFATVLVHALSVGTSVNQHSYCGRSSGWAYAYASGGVPPYTYSWSNGGTDYQIMGVNAGIYTVTVTDAVLDQATAQAEILLLNNYGEIYVQGAPLGYCSGDPAQMALFTGQNNPFDPYDPTGPWGPPPYSFSHPNLIDYGQSTMCMGNMTPVYNMLFFNAAPGSFLQVDMHDADGCPGILDVYIEAPLAPPMLQIVGIGPSCQNAGTGTMTVAVSGSEGHEFAIYVYPEGSPPACYASQAQGFTFGDAGQQDGLRTFNGLSPGDYYLVWTSDPYGLYEGNSFYDYECRDSIPFTVPMIAGNCGSLSGRLYLDDDADCIMDAAENRVPLTIVTVEPGPYYLTTDAGGQYSAALPYGSYTVNEQSPSLVQSCPAPVTLSAPGTQTVNTACAGGQPLDVMVNAVSGPARPGFELHYGVHVENLTPGSTGTVTLTLEVDPLLTFSSALPTPSSVVGNVIIWTDPQFTMTTAFEERHFYVNLVVPPDIGLIGSVLSATATITTQNADGDLSNNTYLTNVTVTGSVDPNDKTAATSSGLSGSQYFLQQDEWIDYTIRFQNTGTDTAFNILITDTLPPELDPGSVIMGASSHTYSWSMGLTGTLNIAFADIVLPDSNVNEAASHGFVLLRVKPQDPLLPGTIISNEANIYFDFNPPVVTEPSVLTVEFSTSIDHGPGGSAPQLLLAPVPVSDQLMIAADGTMEAIIIHAADGREVMRRPLRVSNTSVDVSGLRAGSYFLMVNMNNGSLVRERFIKN